MFHRRKDAAQQVVNQLMQTEKAIDTALSEASGLVALLPTARLDAGIAAEIGHDAIERAMRSVNALVTARGDIVEAHRALAKARDQMGLRSTAFGGLMPKAADLAEPVRAANAA